ncbi:MAG: histidine--tRNA ligase [Rhodomicrobium sp.]
MSDKKAANQVKARLPKGLRDVEAQELRALKHMLGTISSVYERYGFEPFDTPAFEYTDALGKFLPDTDRPNEGVFSFQDDDEQWVSLRYDLTAPLARYVAANFDSLPKPFRRYQSGYVYRNEKPGPGRYRQFMQFDADTVGTANPAADAEMCMLAADTLEALGIPRDSYVIKISSRRTLDALLDRAKIADSGQRLTVLRAIDKYDRVGLTGIEQLLGEGREDESGDFTKGANLPPDCIARIIDFLTFPSEDEAPLDVIEIVRAAGYNADQIWFQPTVVRGLEYYTGPVFEAELTFPATNQDGQPVRFGSVGGGGRYDGLVSRFRSQPVPATGFSIGVSRLYAALSHLGKLKGNDAKLSPVVVLVMDKARTGDYQRMTRDLRNADIRAEMYVGDSGMKAQMKYADKRGAPCVIIQGEDERARGEVTIKDLFEGARLSGEISDRSEWREARPAQFSVPESEMVAAVRQLLDERSKNDG